MGGKYSRNFKDITQNQGFTLVEMVLVIILIGILAVSVAPRFDGSQSYEPYTYRDQLIASLRLNQLKAMQQTSGHCHQLLLSATQFGVPDVNPCTANPSFSAGWQSWQARGTTEGDITNIAVESGHQVTFSLGGPGLKAINFDAMGRPLEDCAGGCEIVIQGVADSTSLRIESEGYIHAL